MNVDAIAAQANPSTSASAGSSAALVSDYETFLTLLTTQIQFQDPLNPADSTEFVAQLATFSSVEQQIQTNTLLESLAALTGLQSLGEMASWVGMDVKSHSALTYDGSSKTLDTQIPATADSADLVITDVAGAEVGRIALPVGEDTFDWHGQDGRGGELPNGTYTLHIEPFAGEAPMDHVPVPAFQRVIEAQMDAGQPMLLLESGERLLTDEVISLRAPLSE